MMEQLASTQMLATAKSRRRCCLAALALLVSRIYALGTIAAWDSKYAVESPVA